MKIKKEFIKKSVDILIKHENILNKFNKIQKILLETQSKLMSYKNEINEINTIDTNNNTDIKKQQNLLFILNKYEDDIKSLKNKTQPYIDEINNIKKESLFLYQKIMNTYPNKTEEEIKKCLFDEITKYKEKNNINI